MALTGGGVRRILLAGTTLVCPVCPALAGTHGDIAVTNTFVPGLWAPAEETETLTGSVSSGGVFDPALRFGLSGVLRIDLPADSTFGASWGLYRDQALCDTCDGGQGPGALGSELLGSTDLTLTVSHREPLGEHADLILRVDAVVPASRDALVCNPFYGAPGAGATFRLPAGGSTVALGVGARRPFYRYDAAPIGLCAPPLNGDATVAALTGPVEPTPWDGAWFGASNPSLTGAASVAWTEIHRVFERAPERFHSSISTGLQIQRNPVDPARTLQTLTGGVEVRASNRPIRTAIPWEVAAGWSVSQRLDLSLSLANRIPTLLADPGGTFRALPASTALSAAATGHF